VSLRVRGWVDAHTTRRLVPRQARPTRMFIQPSSTCRTRFSEGGRVGWAHPQAHAHQTRRLVPRQARPTRMFIQPSSTCRTRFSEGGRVVRARLIGLMRTKRAVSFLDRRVLHGFLSNLLPGVGRGSPKEAA
jgi:hypothetical protein